MENYKKCLIDKMDRINELIIKRDLLKQQRDKTPNGYYRNELTKEIARLQYSIKFHIYNLKSNPFYRQIYFFPHFS